jgi:hypothetical protein
MRVKSSWPGFQALQQALPIVEVQILVGPQAVQAVGQQDRSERVVVLPKDAQAICA